MSLDLEALETGFDLVAPRGAELMDIVYGRLLAAAPAVRPLFAGTDLRKQRIMLRRVLGLLRKSLRDLGSIVPILDDLGARRERHARRRLSAARHRRVTLRDRPAHVSTLRPNSTEDP